MNNKKTLITGSYGFVGTHLSQALVQTGNTVTGFGNSPALENDTNYHQVDIRDAAEVEGVVASIKPDEIYHLAGVSSVQESLDAASLTHAVNVEGTANLLEAVRKHTPGARLLIVGSAEVYAAKLTPLSEDDALDGGSSPYAQSRIDQEKLVATYDDLNLFLSRSFNHTGPGQLDNFVLSSFARQVAAIKLGQQPPLVSVGNLEVIRDFSDVRDIVSAYIALMEKGECGNIYNIGSGQGYRLQNLLEELIALSGVAIEIQVDPDRLRPADKPSLIADTGKFRAATGWEPQYTISQTLADMIADWEKKLLAENN